MTGGGRAEVSVLVPYQPGGDDHRARAWWYVSRWWRQHFPPWQLLTGCPPAGPWCKALAVSDALTHATGRVLVVADADVIPVVDEVRRIAGLILNGSTGRWGSPHRRVLRLTEAGTEQVLKGGDLPTELPRRVMPGHSLRRRGPLIEQAHTAVIGGGLVIIDRALYEQVPLDPRFTGWGQEDASWGRALCVITGGSPIRAGAPLWHLWHPPAARLHRAVGTINGLALHHRYLAASTPEAMRALLAEIRAAATSG